MHRFLVSALVALVPTLAVVRGAEPSLPKRADVFNQLRVGHPRLLGTRSTLGLLAAQCKMHPRAGQWLERLRADAEKLLTIEPVKYELPDGKRLLSVSREAKDRLLLLGLMYQLSGEQKYADRAWVELAAVTRFKDWNPAHFLDTAEMTFAVAIGYDWLYDAWDAEQRAILREAIVRKGFEPGLAVYRKKGWWSKATHNWNQVCNGGLAIGALAIGDEEPKLASEVLHEALHSLPLAMRQFAPDGGWGEGPGYWRYATEYNVYMLAALQSALGTDFGLCRLPGFSQTGNFPIHLVGPTGKSFNFADAHDGWRGAPQEFWLADAFDQPAYAAAQLPYADARPSPLDLLWGAKWAQERTDEAAALPLASCFEGVAVATMRSTWDDPQAWFVAFKGGDNRVNHGHLDLGTFVLDALGQRWAIDLGPDNYNLPGYFGKQRWTYFRNNTQSHNTPVIDGKNQDPAARAQIVRFAANDAWAGAVADLSDAWPQVQQAWRGIALIERQRVLVQDEFTADTPIAPAWQMLTDARIDVDGRTAILTKGGRHLRATLVEPDGARWEVVELSLSPPERPLHDVRKLAAILSGPGTKLRLAVVFDNAAEPVGRSKIVPLNRWPGERN